PPAGGGELGADAAGELRGLGAGRGAPRTTDELGPGEGGRDVDRGQLPDRALRARQAADEEAIEANQLPRTLRLDMPLPLRPGRLVGRRIARDERQPLRTRVETVPTQAAPDAVVADEDPAPALPAQLARDPPRPVARMTE